MRHFIAASLAMAVLCSLAVPVPADNNKDASAILDKAIKALGGEEKLAGAKAFTMKAKGKLNFMGNESEITTQATAQGINHYRGAFETPQFQGVTVINGDKGWRKFGDMKTELDADAMAMEKRNVYLAVIPVTLLPLKGKEFKIEPAGEEKVGDKPAVGIKVTGPEGKDFQLFFDKETGLPVKQVAKVNFIGNEITLENLFSDYKDFGGVKKATKLVSKHDGEKFTEVEVTEFKVLDKADPKAFDEPQ